MMKDIPKTSTLTIKEKKLMMATISFMNKKNSQSYAPVAFNTDHTKI